MDYFSTCSHLRWDVCGVDCWQRKKCVVNPDDKPFCAAGGYLHWELRSSGMTAVSWSAAASRAARRRHPAAHQPTLRRTTVRVWLHTAHTQQRRRPAAAVYTPPTYPAAQHQCPTFRAIVPTPPIISCCLSWQPNNGLCFSQIYIYFFVCWPIRPFLLLLLLLLSWEVVQGQRAQSRFAV